MKPRSICLITCYIGRMPWYFHYFVHSCGYNPTIDFYVIMDDCTWSYPLPSNVKIRRTTLKQITEIASKRLEVQANIPDGYKLCDFKPAYGLLFSDITNGYDFWGHCDIDIIFGDIREFITDEILDQFDVICPRHDWLTGCFLLYRNIPAINNLFRQSKDHIKVFSNGFHYCFDETNFSHHAFTDGKHYTEIVTPIESMTHVVKRLEASGELKVFFDFIIIEGRPGKLKWQDGKMFYSNKFEVLFYHLIYFKRVCRPPQVKMPLPKEFNIGPTKIYTKAVNSYLQKTINIINHCP
jgi:hypothetical protein